LIDSEGSRPANEFLKRNAFSISKCPRLTFHFDGERGAIHIPDSENRDPLKVRPVITAWSNTAVFELVRNVSCRESQPFVERAAALKIVRRDVREPRPHRVRGENGSGDVLGKKGDCDQNDQENASDKSLS